MDNLTTQQKKLDHESLITDVSNNIEKKNWRSNINWTLLRQLKEDKKVAVICDLKFTNEKNFKLMDACNFFMDITNFDIVQVHRKAAEVMPQAQPGMFSLNLIWKYNELLSKYVKF